MKHTVRSSAAQMTVTCGIVSVLPGVDVGKITTAAVGKELRKHHIPVIAVVSAVLLSVLMLGCPESGHAGREGGTWKEALSASRRTDTAAEAGSTVKLYGEAATNGTEQRIYTG